ncbi:hypothetical protein KIPB_003433 [Kipferlia bialata]|uniref:Uncharacterized protein n=1 Tax=Kipferlia bialata TaxID=797122 RepID=A0A391P1D4_9EUKA|nr:hypothetical protein KIPB_003433 [Kipferlia bialata]|eukprot:g3433.t1
MSDDECSSYSSSSSSASFDLEAACNNDSPITHAPAKPAFVEKKRPRQGTGLSVPVVKKPDPWKKVAAQSPVRKAHPIPRIVVPVVAKKPKKESTGRLENPLQDPFATSHRICDDSDCHTESQFETESSESASDVGFTFQASESLAAIKEKEKHAALMGISLNVEKSSEVSDSEEPVFAMPSYKDGDKYTLPEDSDIAQEQTETMSGLDYSSGDTPRVFSGFRL